MKRAWPSGAEASFGRRCLGARREELWCNFEHIWANNTRCNAGFNASSGYYYYVEATGYEEGDVFDLTYDGSACGADTQIGSVTFSYHM